jgi:hypothetical protein
LATKAIIVDNNTKIEKGITCPPHLRDELYRYRQVVSYLTAKYRKTLTDGYITGLAGTPGAWHLDHIFSVAEGFKYKISPFICVEQKTQGSLVPGMNANGTI